MDELLDSIGTPHRVITWGRRKQSHKENGHRITVLADARNKVLENLYNGKAARRMLGRKFDEVMFMNDVAYCAVDMMEIIYQKRMQGADQVCGVDWGGWGGQVVYDRWVLRAMSGRYASSSTHQSHSYLNSFNHRPFYRWEDMVYYVRAPHPEDGSEKPFSQPLIYDEEDRKRYLSLLPFGIILLCYQRRWIELPFNLLSGWIEIDR